MKAVATEGDLEKGYGLLKVQTAKGTDLCFAGYRPGTYRAGGLETDAQQAFVLMDGQQVRAMYMGGGKMLKVGDVSLSRGDPGLAYIEKAETGAYVVGNPSPTETTITMAFAPLAGMDAYQLGPNGQRTGAATVAAHGGAVAIDMKPVSKVEFAPKSTPSVFDYRQEMLRKRQAEQEASLAKDRNEATARSAARAQEAKAKPVPTNTLVVVQAEDFTGQGGGQVTITDKKRAIIGKAFLRWDGVGHWLEWTIEVPAEGYYNLRVCYCTELALCGREMRVNGQVQEPFAPMVFPTTGGWANGSDDWRLFAAIDPITEAPLLIHLRQGKNTLRLTNTNGRGVNLDYLVISSPDVKVDRQMAAAKLSGGR